MSESYTRQQITLAADRPRAAARTEVNDEVVVQVHRLLNGALADDERTRPLPAVGAYSMSANRPSGGIAETVWGDRLPSQAKTDRYRILAGQRHEAVGGAARGGR